MLTGESRPVSKSTGDAVVGGTVNQGGGALRVRVESTGDETALAGIMRLVEEAQSSKSGAQSLADRAAFWLTIIAVGAALIAFGLWLVSTGSLEEAVRRAVTVLVIACPHALGLAVPLVIAISTTLAARNGLLIRRRLALESARTIDTIIFDKTGTLTTGEQGVVAFHTESMTEADALRVAAAVEADSEHPIAQAIRDYAETQGVERASASDFESQSGRGVRATVDGTRWYVGGPQMIAQHDWHLPEPLQQAADDAREAGQAVVVLADDNTVKAVITIADTIRQESREAIRILNQMGFSVAMLTGDSQAVADAVAADLNIDTVFAEVLPENKSDKVKDLQSNDQHVMMVGDGVNDAPALAQADVGVAIGAGTDVAIESAGIILVKDDPRDVVKLLRLSQKSWRKTIQNLFWATGYNVIAIPLAMGLLAPVGIILPPAVGAAVMSVSTVFVAINAGLLRRQSLTVEPA